jgi:hypothetical protein
MSLEKWVEYGWLSREPTNPREIRDLLGVVERSLADSKVNTVSTDLRFIAAFNAALCVATMPFAHRAIGPPPKPVITLRQFFVSTSIEGEYN